MAGHFNIERAEAVGFAEPLLALVGFCRKARDER
jgi:hypothetical protein